ncbi:MAG: ABC transporter ATP-binding protein [Clostridia bacterium]|nr:ABC transporter ATP-binding protein [Clostridia bacterium]
MLELKNISAGYGKEAVLSSLSLTVARGEVLSVIGANGCGKSTLLRVAAGLLKPISGEVFIDGEALSSLSQRQSARRLSYLAQSRSVPDMTVFELVLHGRFPYLGYPRIYGEADRKKARSAIERMGIGELTERRLSSLSGGMRQKAYIALALCQDTDYILLDEPTVYLDVPSGLELMHALRSLRDGGKGIVTVMHDLPLALGFSDRVAIISGGGLLALGSPEEICDSGCIREVFSIDVARDGDGRFYYRY